MGRSAGKYRDVLLEQVEHRGDPALAEPDPGAYSLLLQLLRTGVRSLLEQRDPGFVPELAPEQVRRVGGQRDLDAADRLRRVPVAGEGIRGDLNMELHARACGLGGDAVSVGEQLLGAVDGDPEILAAGGEDLLVHHPVARVGRQRALVHVLLPQGRQDADHDEAAAAPPGLGVGRVEIGANLLLQAIERVTAQLAGRHVDLDIELSELGSPGRIGDRVEHVGIAHRRLAALVDEVQLDLLADPRRGVLEYVLPQHPVEHVERAPELLPVLAAVLAADLDRLNITAHPASLSWLGYRRSALASPYSRMPAALAPAARVPLSARRITGTMCE